MGLDTKAPLIAGFFRFRGQTARAHPDGVVDLRKGLPRSPLAKHAAKTGTVEVGSPRWRDIEPAEDLFAGVPADHDRLLGAGELNLDAVGPAPVYPHAGTCRPPSPTSLRSEAAPLAAVASMSRHLGDPTSTVPVLPHVSHCKIRRQSSVPACRNRWPRRPQSGCRSFMVTSSLVETPYGLYRARVTVTTGALLLCGSMGRPPGHTCP
jgi:hypothetical protein